MGINVKNDCGCQFVQFAEFVVSCSGISEWSVVDDYLTTSLYKFGCASAIGAGIMAFGLRKFSSLGGCRCRA